MLITSDRYILYLFHNQESLYKYASYITAIYCFIQNCFINAMCRLYFETIFVTYLSVI
jgi:hypothetical protein